MKNNQKQDNQCGNVFLFVLIGVVLFATLAITLTRGMRSQTTATMSKREALLTAAEIIDYAQKLQRSVDRLRRRNCSENEISFQTPNTTGYINPDAPGDSSCHIFHPNGGNVSWKKASEDWADVTYRGSTHYGEWLFTSNNQVGLFADCALFETTCSDLIATTFYITREACLAINEKLGITNTGGEPPVELNAEFYDDKFIGGFSSRNELSNNAAALSGHFTGCFQEGFAAADPPIKDSYAFFHTLLRR